MQIECPRCQARASWHGPRSATVRCGACGATYRLKAQRARGPGAAFWGTSGAVVAVLALVLALRAGRDDEGALAAGDDAPAPAAAPPTGRPAAPDVFASTDWSSPLVRLAAEAHRAAFAGDRAALLGLLAEPAPAERLLASDEPFAARFWEPYDGELLEAGEDTALVRLSCRPRPQLAAAHGERAAPEPYTKRSFDWRLARTDDGWRLVDGERWISPEEARALLPHNERVVLSDGSRVVERPGEHLGHLEDTSPELRARIDGLVATMLDPDLTRESAAARAELVALGRPAVPVLLTELYESPFETREDAIRCNQLVQTLRSITGQSFGFEPLRIEGSALGTTDERRESAIRQWFAWWNMNEDEFGLEEEPPAPARRRGV